MPYSTSDLISIAHAIRDIERGFDRAKKRTSEVDVRIDSSPIYLRGKLVGHGVRDAESGRLGFLPLVGSEVVIESLESLEEGAPSDEGAEFQGFDDDRTAVIEEPGGGPAFNEVFAPLLEDSEKD